VASRDAGLRAMKWVLGARGAWKGVCCKDALGVQEVAWNKDVQKQRRPWGSNPRPQG